MPTARDNFATAVLRGQVYVAGGPAPMPTARIQLWLVAAGRYLYAIG
jgi:hypothetical protein